MLFSAAFGIVSAMVGAGFASGREIMTFFTRYGPFSWLLIPLAAAMIGWLTYSVMGINLVEEALFPNKIACAAGRIVTLLMFAAVGGAMTAAAGELSALTAPLLHARSLGMLLTLFMGVLFSKRSVRVLGMIGKVLIPLMLLAFFFCFRVPPQICGAPPVSPVHPAIAILQLAGYCGLNVALSTGVIYEAGFRCKEKKKLTVCTGILIGLLLYAGNAALLPHAAEMNNTALPVVALLRNYGKPGFYLSAAVLYLAVFSTLIAILRTMKEFFPWKGKYQGLWAGILCAVFSVLGFGTIVETAYSALGWLGILLILGKKFIGNGTKRSSASSIGRIPHKEENTE